MSIKSTVGYMLAQACKLHRQRAEVVLSEIGLHAGQEMLLCGLWENEGTTQTELAEYVMIQPATVTNMLQRLERERIIERKPDVDDQRISRVYTTKKAAIWKRKLRNSGASWSRRLSPDSALKSVSCFAGCSCRFIAIWPETTRTRLFFGNDT